MKPTKFILSSTCLALAVLCGIARAQTSNLVYQETFYVPKDINQSVTNVGWINELCGAFGHDSRIFSGSMNGAPINGVSWPASAVYTYNENQTNGNEAFYFTVATANGGPYDVSDGDGAGPVTNKMAFPGINLSTVANLSFAVACNNGPGATEQAHWAVQINNGQWYVSTNYFTQTGSAFQNFSFIFTNTAGAWNQLTVSGNNVILNGTNVVVGPPAGADLSGYITGAGLVFEYTTPGGSLQFNNYAIYATTSSNSCLPVFWVEPLNTTNFPGTTATFSEEDSLLYPAPTSFQWMAGAIGSGVYSNLTDGGQISGSTSNVLQISNLTSANQLDYVLVGSNECGSVTSSPPATLWVVGSPPTPLSDTFIYPDDAPNLASSSVTLHAGNHNVMNFAAIFIGSEPISFQWQFSPTNDGTGAVPVSGATNSSLTLSDPPTSASGYYRLSATNSQGGPAYSDWGDLTVLPAATAQIQWSAKVPFTGMTAAQILNGTPGAFFEAESFNNYGTVLSVTNGTTVFVFDTTGVSASETGGYTTWPNQYNGTTGDTNLDSVLGTVEEGVETITLNNLTAGRRYSAQLFAFDDNEGPALEANFSDPNDLADVSQSFAMGDNVYVVGTFMATNATEAITLNGDSGLYGCCVIVRALAATPAIQWSGSNLQVNWDYGTLLEATNLTGPWTTNAATPPYVFSPTNPALFFRTQFP
ncbi:MAG: hypothetical protein WBN22_08140 [Verrucomicrobiia bacterium]